MKTKMTALAIFAFVATASAFYNPEVGRWLSRDPIGEPGFRLATKTTRKADKHFLDYAFVVNAPISIWDYLGLDNPGCDLPAWVVPSWNRDCFLRCCAAHDMCYFNERFRNGRACTAGSWPQVLNPCSPCGRCNRQVLGCFLGCLLGIDTNPGPMWFCSQGPSANTVYFDWNAIPADCWDGGIKPPQP